MKNLVSTFFFLVVLTGCLKKDYECNLIGSPSKNYFIKATVNRTDSKADDFEDVILHIFDSDSNLINRVNTKAGDHNKWSVGWTLTGDTIVLQSSDIGNRAWIVTNTDLKEIEITELLNIRAMELKTLKYK